MFNLFRSSDKLKKYLLGGLLTLVALSMITYLIPNYNTGTTDTTNPVLANIGGKKITALEAQQLFQKYSAGRIPADLMEVYLPQFVESMISQRAAHRISVHVLWAATCLGHRKAAIGAMTLGRVGGVITRPITPLCSCSPIIRVRR